MLDAVAGEGAVLARVEPDGDRDHDRALRKAQALGDGRARVRVRERLLELRERLPVERRVPLELRLDDRLGHAEECRPEQSRRYSAAAGVAKLEIRG